MTARKSSVLLTCHLLPNCVSIPGQSTTSSFSSTRQSPCPSSQHVQTYATIAGDGEDESRRRASSACRSEHVWPQPAKGQTRPTPYQIFDLKHHEQYSKARFYELVKIYHPDSNTGTSSANDADGDASGGQARLERYRMLVAAHNILSDPIKRSAYDRFGAGWDGKAEVGDHRPWSESTTKAGAPPGPFSHSWHQSGTHDDTIWQNATWEDWERWHERKAGYEARAPLYMSNVSFVALVAALAMIGGSMNYSRAQDAGAYIVEQRDIVHDRAARELRRVRQEKHAISSRQDRIDFFVRQREATVSVEGFDVEAMRSERADRLLPDKQVCKSDDVSQRDLG